MRGGSGDGGSISIAELARNASTSKADDAPMGRAGELRPLRDEHEKVPIRIGPFDSPDRRPNRMVEATTSCRVDSVLRRVAFSGDHASRDPRLRRGSDRGRPAMPARPAPSQSNRSEEAPKSVGSAVESTGRMREFPEWESPPGMDTETTVSVGRTGPWNPHEPSKRGETRRGRRTTRHRGSRPPEEHIPHSGGRHLKPSSRDRRHVCPASRTALNGRVVSCPPHADCIFATTCCGGNRKSTTFRHPFDDSWNGPKRRNTEATRIFQHTIWVWTDVRRRRDTTSCG